jgi:hypothetical protein
MYVDFKDCAGTMIQMQVYNINNGLWSFSMFGEIFSAILELAQLCPPRLP